MDNLVKTLNEDDFKILKKEFPINWELLNKKVSLSHMNILKNLEDYSKDISTLTKKDYLSNLKNDYPDDEEIKRTK